MDIMEQTWRHGAGNGVAPRTESIGMGLPTDYRAKVGEDKEKDEKQQQRKKKKKKKKLTPGTEARNTKKNQKRKKRNCKGQKVKLKNQTTATNGQPPRNRIASGHFSPRVPYASSSRNQLSLAVRISHNQKSSAAQCLQILVFT